MQFPLQRRRPRLRSFSRFSSPVALPCRLPFRIGFAFACAPSLAPVRAFVSAIAIALTSLFPTAIAAQAPEDSREQGALEERESRTTDEVEVVAPLGNGRGEDPEPAASADRIELREGAARGRLQDAGELLEREAGVRVERYGGLGAYSTVSIRGSSANQVNVYLDGIPLGSSQSGEVNLSDLNVSGLRAMDVYRSGAPGLAGGSGIGGAVNLLPFKGTEGGESGVRLSGTGGSFGTYRLGAEGWGGGENWNAALGGSYSRSDQNFVFRNDNGTPLLNTFDDFDDVRQNAQFRDVGLTGYGSYQWGATELKALNDFKYRLHGVPGPGGNQTEQTEREYLRNTTGFGTDTRGLFADWFRLQSRVFYSENREQFFDPRQEFSSGQPNSSARWQSYGLHLSPELYLLDWNQILRISAGLEEESYQRINRNRFHWEIETDPKKFRRRSFVYFQDEIRFFEKRLLILPGLRLEEYADRFNLERDYAAPRAALQAILEGAAPESVTRRRFANPELGLRGVLYRGEDAELYLKGFAARTRRAPTFLELFGERGSVIGNAELAPERSESAEIGPGLEWKRIRTPWLEDALGFSTEAIFFRRWVQDLILFVPNSQFTLRPENADSAEIEGLELSFKATLGDWLSLYNNYTYQRAINTSSVPFLRGKFLPLRPLHENQSGVDLAFEHWGGGAEASFVGAVFKDRTNEAAAYEDSRWIWNAYLSYSWFGRSRRDEEELLFTLEVKNLLDERVEDVVGYPLPGRSFFGSVTWRF